MSTGMVAIMTQAMLHIRLVYIMINLVFGSEAIHGRGGRESNQTPRSKDTRMIRMRNRAGNREREGKEKGKSGRLNEKKGDK